MIGNQCSIDKEAPKTMESPNVSPGQVIWITGLSGAGKTTFSRKLLARLRLRTCNTVLLDGDELREIFNHGSLNKNDYDRAERIKLAMKYSKLCKLLAEQDLTVIIATISLFKEIHLWNRMNIQRYIEVYIDVPLEELRRRDSKGIYSKFDSGDIKNVAGLDIAVDLPIEPSFIYTFNGETTMEDSVANLTDIIINEDIK